MSPSENMVTADERAGARIAGAEKAWAESRTARATVEIMLFCGAGKSGRGQPDEFGGGRRGCGGGQAGRGGARPGRGGVRRARRELCARAGTFCSMKVSFAAQIRA